MMVTFEPLPREFLQAANPPARLTNFRERWRLLSSSGIERLDAMLNFAARVSPVRVRTVLSGNERLALTISRLIV